MGVVKSRSVGSTVIDEKIVWSGCGGGVAAMVGEVVVVMTLSGCELIVCPDEPTFCMNQAK